MYWNEITLTAFLARPERLIETWDVLKLPCQSPEGVVQLGLIETWDVLKS